MQLEEKSSGQSNEGLVVRRILLGEELSASFSMSHHSQTKHTHTETPKEKRRGLISKRSINNEPFRTDYITLHQNKVQVICPSFLSSLPKPYRGSLPSLADAHSLPETLCWIRGNLLIDNPKAPDKHFHAQLLTVTEESVSMLLCVWY